jgi:hypothetical protein
LTRKLTIDNTFLPCLEEENDELFPNGIFKFNITKLLRFIQNNPGDFFLEEIALDEFKTYSSLNESHINTVDLSRPVILAEISPGRYIDLLYRAIRTIKTFEVDRLKADYCQER